LLPSGKVPTHRKKKVNGLKLENYTAAIIDVPWRTGSVVCLPFGDLTDVYVASGGIISAKVNSP
jgi:hypothetical protein